MKLNYVTKIAVPWWLAVAAGFLLIVLGIMAITSSGQPPQKACNLTQPVYAGTVQVGTWQATLLPGQSVPLPDGDTATCTTAAQLDVHN